MFATRSLIVASPATLAEIVAQLPAAERAQVAWAPKRVAELLRPLLTEPSLTDGLIDGVVHEYLETTRVLLQPMLRFVRQDGAKTVITAGQSRDTDSLMRLPAAACKAAMRADVTQLIAGLLGQQLAATLDHSTIDRALESDAGGDALHRSSVLLLAVFEGLEKGSSIPGRLSALARRADEAAKAFAVELAAGNLRLPWYFEDAVGAERFVRFASWSPEPAQAPREPTNEELEAWEKVKAGVDSARPHRKVFS